VKVKIRKLGSEKPYYEGDCHTVMIGTGVELAWLRVDRTGALVVAGWKKYHIEDNTDYLFLEAPKEDSNGLG